MPSWEAVCDCCMKPVALETPELTLRDCPYCGVGKLLGPWAVRPRFDPSAAFDVSFRRPSDEESPKRD